MKQLALLLLMLCVFKTGQAVIIINAQISFGAKSNDCKKGFGICMIQVDSRGESNQNKVRISMSPDGQSILIDFPNELIASHPELFRDGSFVQEENYEMPEEIQKQFAASAVLIIPAGKYRMQDLGDHQRISVPNRP